MVFDTKCPQWTPAQRDEVQAWVRSRGLDPKTLRPDFYILKTDQGYELHATTPVVVQLGDTPDWPTFLAPHSV